MMMQGIRKASQGLLGKLVISVLFGVLILAFAIWGVGDIFRGYGRNEVAKIGKAEIGDVLSARYKQIPDMRWEEIRHWISGEDKALSEWVVRGTPIGGKPFEYLGCDLWEFRDGFVTKKDTYWKFIG